MGMRGSITPHQGQADAWRLRVYLGKDPVTGKERYRSKVFRGNKRQADKVLNQMVTEANVSAKPASNSTLEQLLSEWLTFCRGKGLSPKTMRDYEWCALQRIAPELGSIPINELTPKHLDDYYAKLRDQSYSLATIRHSHGVLRLALGQAVKWGWIDRNVALLATVAGPASTPVVSPSVEQLRAILTEMGKSNVQFQALVALAALTGARRGELLALRWGDVDLAHSALWIRGGLVYTPETGTVLGPTKTKRIRKVPLDAVAVAVIEGQMQALIDNCEKLELAPVENPWLFFGEVDGSKPLHPDSISTAFRRITKKLGIDGIHFHSLRHFTATQLIAAGVDIRTVSGRLGHANSAITLRVYSHVLEENDRAASDIMGRLLGP